MRRPVAVLAAVALTSATLGACTSSNHKKRVTDSTAISSGSSPSAPTSGTSSSPSAPTSRTSTAAGLSAAQRALNRMSEKQRVGQLLMVDCPTTGVAQATTEAIARYAVGSVILDGTSYAGLQETATVTRKLQSLAPKGTKLFIATDQEGGQVQRLQGPGFTRIVSGVRQGAIAPSQLEGFARGWGTQLVQAGVNVNLAPVLDTVPAGFGSNPPIGDLDREYGHTPAAVTAHGLAVVRGMTAAGIDVTVKHFPGLGRVTGNTDTTSGVSDTVTTRTDPYLAPFRAAVAAGVPFVMMSTASYERIDPGTPAAFSPRIIGGMLRGDLGFRGLVISDDLGAAAQVGDLSPGGRAVQFVAAGGDIVLTVDPRTVSEMAGDLLAKTRTDPAFKKKVDAAALLVLQEKQRRGLL